LGIRVHAAFHLQANSIKENASGTIELESPNGISLKCGGNVLTVDGSGIHLKASTVDTTSSNGGVSANSVVIPKIEKPLYNKLKVIEVQPSVTKQTKITQELTYTAVVQKYENGAWVQTTDLTPTQKMQLQWVFIKNNDENDTDIVTDEPTNDTIQIDGLKMHVTLDKDNVHKYAHVHCYVSEAKDEGYTKSQLQRKLEVIDIDANYVSQEKGECEAVLNVEQPSPDEIAQIRWSIEGKEKPNYNGKKTITHNLKDEKVYEINFTAYIQNDAVNAANAMLVYDEENERLVNLRLGDE
jgi:type VI secretion system secreted protein VgrG